MIKLEIILLGQLILTSLCFKRSFNLVRWIITFLISLIIYLVYYYFIFIVLLNDTNSYIYVFLSVLGICFSLMIGQKIYYQDFEIKERKNGK